MPPLRLALSAGPGGSDPEKMRGIQMLPVPLLALMLRPLCCRHSQSKEGHRNTSEGQKVAWGGIGKSIPSGGRSGCGNGQGRFEHRTL